MFNGLWPGFDATEVPIGSVYGIGSPTVTIVSCSALFCSSWSRIAATSSSVGIATCSQPMNWWSTGMSTTFISSTASCTGTAIACA